MDVYIIPKEITFNTREVGRLGSSTPSTYVTDKVTLSGSVIFPKSGTETEVDITLTSEEYEQISSILSSAVTRFINELKEAAL